MLYKIDIEFNSCKFLKKIYEIQNHSIFFIIRQIRVIPTNMMLYISYNTLKNIKIKVRPTDHNKHVVRTPWKAKCLIQAVYFIEYMC